MVALRNGALKRKEVSMVTFAKQTLYDRLRAQIPAILPPNRLLITRGVSQLGDEAVGVILAKVKNFHAFTTDNDPWEEHDFGNFEHEGRKLFWKIDDHAGRDGNQLVLTIMLSEEY
jgi:uncharacterized protein DUF3768